MFKNVVLFELIVVIAMDPRRCIYTNPTMINYAGGEIPQMIKRCVVACTKVLVRDLKSTNECCF